MKGYTGVCAPNAVAKTIFVTLISKAIPTFAQKFNNMSILITMEMLVKCLLLVLGIMAGTGHRWAFWSFVTISSLSLLLDIILALVAHSAEKDIERNEQP